MALLYTYDEHRVYAVMDKDAFASLTDQRAPANGGDAR